MSHTNKPSTTNRLSLGTTRTSGLNRLDDLHQKAEPGDDLHQQTPGDGGEY